MRFFLAAFLTLFLSTLTRALHVADPEVAQAHQVERRQGNAGPVETTLSDASSVHDASASASASSTTASVSSVNPATTSATSTGAEQGAGAKAQVPVTSSSKGGAPMPTNQWAAAGILAVGVGGLMI
ncbi:MAG: hypothetical protein FRX48_09418 [Lasallia pustulata]|uniref:Uncharacterized protein n=1 Tax=Lasallia pustulata TaxID=136370 RepID=A0A5M8PBT1_9LECA|nr:MAG: hypothetical protein FRX48_09418 [Lasallia pustulata]